MPSSPLNSSDSPPPSETRSSSPDGAPLAPVVWRTNLALFVATVVCMFATRLWMDEAPFASRAALINALEFTATLLTILVAHELGHFIAARIHRVDASLPYFIPMPLSPFGTMGAVIRMRGVIPTRRALLDIGASGPLAGLAFAIPLYLWGAAHSHLVLANGPDMMELGESLALKALDRIAAPNAPAGMELFLSPVAFGAWAGMFVTMINLIPVGQLDGGHVAYALFGPKQDRYAQLVHRSMLVFFFVSLGRYLVHDLVAGFGFLHLGVHVGNSIFWLVWFEMLAILGAVASRTQKTQPADTLTVRTRLIAILGLVVVASVGRERSSLLLWIAWFVGLGLLLTMEVRGGALRPNTLLDHPPTGSAKLDGARAAIAIATLLVFIALFMPTPIAM